MAVRTWRREHGGEIMVLRAWRREHGGESMVVRACVRQNTRCTAPGGTTSVLTSPMTRNSRQQPVHDNSVWQDGDEVVAMHRQNQVRQLEDTCSINGLCAYKYQLATQDRQNEQFIHFIHILIA